MSRDIKAICNNLQHVKSGQYFVRSTSRRKMKSYLRSYLI